MRSPGRPLLTLLAAVAVGGGWLIAPRPLYAQAQDLAPLAQAYTAAWNAHDLKAVLAFFAPDAVVRERWGDVPLAVWDTRDPHVVDNYLNDDDAPNHHATNGFAWVTGHQRIGAWAAGRFALQHREVAGSYRAVGGTVGWPYQQFSDPSQGVAGIGPLEGTAEAVVRGGRITVLTLVLSPASVQRQRSEVASFLDQALATQRTSPPAPFQGGASGQSGGRLHDGPVPAEPISMAWPLALGGLALLAAITASLRRRCIS